MELVALDVNVLHLRVADLATGWIFSAVQTTGHFQSLGRGGLSDELNDRFVITQWLSTPIRGDEGKAVQKISSCLEFNYDNH